MSSDLKRLFGNGAPSELKVKWALDTKTQQGHFPKMSDIARLRSLLQGKTPEERRKRALGTVGWCSGICALGWGEGTRLNCDYNVPAWTAAINRLYAPKLSAQEPEIIDLLVLSWLRAVAAETKNGTYQALAFQRRATIVLGVGSVGGRRFSSWQF